MPTVSIETRSGSKVLDKLRARAARHHRSIQDELVGSSRRGARVARERRRGFPERRSADDAAQRHSKNRGDRERSSAAMEEAVGSRAASRRPDPCRTRCALSARGRGIRHRARRAARALAERRLSTATRECRTPCQAFLAARHPRLFVLTSAGCSTDSGIPDYRDAEGDWKRAPPVMFQPFMGDLAVRRRYWARSLIGWRASVMLSRTVRIVRSPSSSAMAIRAARHAECGSPASSGRQHRRSRSSWPNGSRTLHGMLEPSASRRAAG